MEEREAIPILSWSVVRGAFVVTREGKRGAQEALVVRKRRSGCANGARGSGTRFCRNRPCPVESGEKEGKSRRVCMQRAEGSQERRTANSASRRTASRLFLVAREHEWALVRALAAGRIVLPFVRVR
jgi:hypothetical protein